MQQNINQSTSITSPIPLNFETNGKGILDNQPITTPNDVGNFEETGSLEANNDGSHYHYDDNPLDNLEEEFYTSNSFIIDEIEEELDYNKLKLESFQPMNLSKNKENEISNNDSRYYQDPNLLTYPNELHRQETDCQFSPKISNQQQMMNSSNMSITNHFSNHPSNNVWNYVPMPILGNISKQPNGVTERDINRMARKDMKNWLAANIYNPYPSTQIKQMFSNKYGLTMTQVDVFFINHRKRFLNRKGMKKPPQNLVKYFPPPFINNYFYYNKFFKK